MVKHHAESEKQIVMADKFYKNLRSTLAQADLRHAVGVWDAFLRRRFDVDGGFKVVISTSPEDVSAKVQLPAPRVVGVERRSETSDQNNETQRYANGVMRAREAAAEIQQKRIATDKLRCTFSAKGMWKVSPKSEFCDSARSVPDVVRVIEVMPHPIAGVDVNGFITCAELQEASEDFKNAGARILH